MDMDKGLKCVHSHTYTHIKKKPLRQTDFL